jgi:hypothetical protein
VRKTIKDCLNEESTRMGRDVGRAKVVQVIRGIDDLSVLVVSDKTHSVSVMLTRECMEEFRRLNPLKNLVSLKGNMIKLEKWHFSSLFLSAGARSLSALLEHKLTRPLVVQTGKISLLGGNGISVIGSPVDINADADVKESYLHQMSHMNMMSLLQRQFPNEYNFPDAEGKFKIPRLYDEKYELRLDHCIIPHDQRQEMDAHDAFDQTEFLTVPRAVVAANAKYDGDGDGTDADDTLSVAQSGEVPMTGASSDQSKLLGQILQTQLPSQLQQSSSSQSQSQSQSKSQSRTQTHTQQSSAMLSSYLCTQPMTQENLDKMDDYFDSTHPSGNDASPDKLTRDGPDPATVIGRQLRKTFEGHGSFVGKVVAYNDPFYMVVYSDGDSEELLYSLLSHLLIDERGGSDTKNNGDEDEDEGNGDFGHEGAEADNFGNGNGSGDEQPAQPFSWLMNRLNNLTPHDHVISGFRNTREVTTAPYVELSAADMVEEVVQEYNIKEADPTKRLSLQALQYDLQI